jgi:hypothetical protein
LFPWGLRCLARHALQYGAKVLQSWASRPGIKIILQKRRIEMREVYAKIPEASIGVRGALKSYLSDIKEIQRYLSYDLTPVGIEAIRPTAQKAVMDGDNVKEAGKPVLAAIDLVKTEMPQGN